MTLVRKKCMTSVKVLSHEKDFGVLNQKQNNLFKKMKN